MIIMKLREETAQKLIEKLCDLELAFSELISKFPVKRTPMYKHKLHVVVPKPSD